ncbi:hypothetical protein FNL39_103704 [Nocardia caishijiensis]|uniref:Uncharacterized protein n=1 Tax=Nocardia caishijiensis TaxID=184756 RepID=A0ABQ6YPP3_9NOCA|nr:hypothetical protein FNL39_103704 [Nocardia caishijiensis]
MHRLNNTRTKLRYLLFERRHHRSDRNAKVFSPSREYGGWTVRPARGWRSVRWITPPLHFTCDIPADQREAAVDWAMEKLGL